MQGAWARFDLYANRVQYVQDEDDLSDLFYRLAHLRTGVAPLQNLRRLSLLDVPALRLHFPPHIRSLAIAVPLRLGGKTAEAILAQFSAQVSLLEELKLSGPFPVTILPVITTLNHLRCLDLDRIDLPRPIDSEAFDEFVKALSFMPTIRELDLPRVRAGEPTPPNCGGFSRLELLSSWDAPKTLARFIKALDTRCLHHIHVSSRLESTTELYNCLTIICASHGESITTVDMGRAHDFIEDLSWMDAIQPLLNLPRLTCAAFPLTLHGELSVADARRLATAWPLLTRIGGLRFSSPDSAYQAIITISHLCPSLQFLDIYVDGKCIGPFPEAHISMHPLRILNVNFSHLGHLLQDNDWQTKEFGAWLNMMFPHLTVTRGLTFRHKWLHVPIETAVEMAQAVRYSMANATSPIGLEVLAQQSISI
ncbi:hypothetical protein HWV62_19009 [Athelia sp. TMB]|nr:hypothetical protein HWV62_19009 [Athelia sp. TMB]